MATSDTRSPRRAGYTLALLAFTQFIVTIDYNIVYVALPDIGRELGFSAQSLQWVVSAYAVALGGLLLFGGRAVDRIGPRRMLVTGLVIYALSSLAGGLAQDAVLLVAARAAQGVGGALLTPATLMLVFTTFAPGPERNRATSVWGAMGSAGLAAGSLLGGVLTSAFGWSWVFFVNVPLALATAFAASRILPVDRPLGNGRSFDALGAVVATIGSTLLVFGLVSGPDKGWGSIEGAGSLGVGVLLLAVFVLVEKRSADPLVPLKLFGLRGLVVAMLALIVFQASSGGTYYLLTTYLQNVLDYGPLTAGLAFLPPTVACMLVAMKLNARVLGWLGVRTTLFWGSVGTAVGLAAIIAGMSAHGSYWTVLPGVVIWGAGGGFAFPSLFVAIGSSGAEPAQQGVASALASTWRQIGGALGLAGLVAVANSHAGSNPDTVALVDGLRTAGWVAAVGTLGGAFIGLGLKKQPRPTPEPAPAATTTEVTPDLTEAASQVG
ncbi:MULTISPECIES: MFS transporter [Streptomyces]|uniref:MFS transporter n=1 Tax=Streptomyces TaxID=1883 RepID=UPI00069192DF|nr:MULTISPECIES: MFS transporter [Streptomyces]